LSESERNGDTEEWRLLLRDDGGVGDLGADLEASLRPGLSVEFAKLAEELDLPRSTLQYRLQQAESWIVERFVRNSTLGDVALALRERDSRTVTA